MKLRTLLRKTVLRSNVANSHLNSDLQSFMEAGGLARFGANNLEERYFHGENTAETNFDGHYIYHPAWAARIIKNIAPAKHMDISSTLHFCTQLSAFMPVEFYDYRPAHITLDNLVMGRADLTQLHFETNSIECLSCMHTVEHIGLGRYGDPLDPDGDLKAIEELKRVVMPGGNLLFVVPIGKPKLVFNAHRIYSFAMIMEYFVDFDLKDFSLVDDLQQFHSSSSQSLADQQAYGCGCFWFKKVID